MVYNLIELNIVRGARIHVLRGRLASTLKPDLDNANGGTLIFEFVAYPYGYAFFDAYSYINSKQCFLTSINFA
jgi:hypothetical protein